MVLSALSEHCPSWSTCLELELLPHYSSFSMSYSCGFSIHYFQEFVCHDVYHISKPILMKNDLVKMSSSELSLIHCEATQKHLLAQLQSGMPCCGNRAVKVQEYLKLVSASPHTLYTMCYVSTANSFILIKQCCYVFSLVCSICTFHCLLPWCLHFPFISSLLSQVFSPE